MRGHIWNESCSRSEDTGRSVDSSNGHVVSTAGVELD